MEFEKQPLLSVLSHDSELIKTVQIKKQKKIILSFSVIAFTLILAFNLTGKSNISSAAVSFPASRSSAQRPPNSMSFLESRWETWKRNQISSETRCRQWPFRRLLVISTFLRLMIILRVTHHCHQQYLFVTFLTMILILISQSAAFMMKSSATIPTHLATVPFGESICFNNKAL